MEQTKLSLAVPEKEFKRRVAREFFLVARESAVGAVLTILVVIITHWSAQPLAPLFVWTAAATGALVLRGVSAEIYLRQSPEGQERWYGVLYGVQWFGFVLTGVIWVMSLSLLGSGQVDTLFFVRTIFVIAVMSFYLSVIGIDRRLYAAFAITMALGFWINVEVYYPQFTQDMPSTPIALGLYCTFLLVRSRSEQKRLHDLIRAHISQDLLLEELKVQATRDGLTGTNNRGQIESELRRLIKLEERLSVPFSILLLDVDHFKQINDTHGHDAGDVVLRQLVQCAAGTLRDTDILGRWGGEEFLAILPDTGSDAAMEVAERLRAAIAGLELEIASGQTIRITASIGIARHRHGENGDVVSKHADLALYSAKQAGRNCCKLYGSVLSGAQP